MVVSKTPYLVYSMTKHTLDRIIQNQVDLMLFEEGCFSPLNWLLSEAYLDYNDYQKWKKGNIEYLEDCFKLSNTEIIAALKKAQDYASVLKLDSFKQHYSSTSNQTLHFCRLPANELIFTSIYEPARDRVQMDLFFDSAHACNLSDLITAIVDNCYSEVTEIMTRLKNSNPDKYEHFLRLLALEKKISQSRTSPKKKIKFLHLLSPLASELLGRCTQDFLIPLWRSISTQIADVPFDPKDPEYHLSFTAFQGFQWQHVLISIEREKDWTKHSLLLFRYAEACFKLNREQEGIVNWFKSFILCSKTAEQLIINTCNHLLFSEWQSFSELDSGLESFLFPAWMVINKPALATHNVISEINGNEAFQLIINLTENTEKEINETTIHLRTLLKQTNPDLFVHYMNAI